MKSTAVFGGKKRRFRYVLRRKWAKGLRCLFIMLNPSTANARKNDPTVARCVDYAWRWGFGSLVVCNLFAYRSTNPKKLRRVDDPVGPRNLQHLLKQAHKADLIICAWGTHGDLLGQGEVVKKLLRKYELHCLVQTKDGHPNHPLYLAKSLKPKRFQ